MPKFVTNLRFITKGILGFVLTFVALMQVDAVADKISPILLAHPKISAVVGGLMSIGMLLLNPQIQKILHIDDEIAELQKPAEKIDESPADPK